MQEHLGDRRGGCTGRALRNIIHICYENVSCCAFKDMQVYLKMKDIFDGRPEGTEGFKCGSVLKALS